MNPPTAFIFVYGTLMRRAKHPAHKLVSQYFKWVCNGRVEGRLFSVGEYPAAVPASGSFVEGELYTINHPQQWPQALAALDDYEGVETDERRSLFVRQTATIYLDSGTATAYVYWYNQPLPKCQPIVSGNFLQYLADQNLPDDHFGA